MREALKYLNVERGIELHHDGDLPARSGMGSSSAFTVGLVHALHALRGELRTKLQLAQDAIHIEQNLLRETVGSQDQMMAAFGGFKYVQFQTDGKICVEPVPLAPRRLRELQAHLMLFYTGIARTASDVAHSYAADLNAHARSLKLMHGHVEEGIDILMSGIDIRNFGELLHEAWQTKRALSARVSNARVDELYDRARGAGAIGGKLTGAGGGGFLLLFVPPRRRPAVLAALAEQIHVPFAFESAGSQVIFYEPGVDYQKEEKARRGRPAALFRELPSAV